MLIITMDTAEKYKNRRDAYVVWSKETITLPEVTKGARRDFDFKPSTVRFDSYRDATNVGGMVYKYFVFDLRDQATNKLLYFETNHPQLNSLIRNKPDKREEFLTLTEKSEYPADIK